MGASVVHLVYPTVDYSTTFVTEVARKEAAVIRIMEEEQISTECKRRFWGLILTGWRRRRRMRKATGNIQLWTRSGKE